MLSNPPYGKSWKKDREFMGSKSGLLNPRFKVMHAGEELSLITRSSDGQMLFLANLVSRRSHGESPKNGSLQRNPNRNYEKRILEKSSRIGNFLLQCVHGNIILSCESSPRSP